MCKLIDELQKLKKSSNESIDNEHSFSLFKKYMHIERQIQRDLEQIIYQTKAKKKALVLVCGNVGDGKSHLVSYLKNEEKLLDNFIIHNDATESYSRNQTEKQALAKVISAFSDSNIDSDIEAKVIVAINLGVLSNFIYSDEGKGFSKLRQYVEASRVLVDDDSIENQYDSDVFYHVNFGDYHLYRLNDGTVDSPYLKNLLHKIFDAHQDNPFYRVYKNSCDVCPYSEQCPVKANFEMVQDDRVKAGITRILIEAIIKDKLIISTRELLNFVYDITVHPSISPNSYKGEFSLEYLLPNLLYNHSDFSDLLSHISKFDLMNIRNEHLDDVISRFVNSLDPIKMYKQYIAKSACQAIIEKSYAFGKVKEKNNSYLTLFIRLIKLIPISNEIMPVNEEYSQYLQYLYAATRRDNTTIRQLARIVEACVYKWTGSEDKKKIIIREIGDLYFIATTLEIRIGRFSEKPEKSETVFDKFSERIKLNFYVESKGKRIHEELYIDYELYEMLIKIHNGYKVSAKEVNYYAAFFSFVERLITHSRYKTELTINVRSGLKSYKLRDESYEDEEPNYEFEEVM